VHLEVGYATTIPTKLYNLSVKSSGMLHSILNLTPTLHQMKKTSDVVFKFLTNRKK